MPAVAREAHGSAIAALMKSALRTLRTIDIGGIAPTGSKVRVNISNVAVFKEFTNFGFCVCPVGNRCIDDHVSGIVRAKGQQTNFQWLRDDVYEFGSASRTFQNVDRVTRAIWCFRRLMFVVDQKDTFANARVSQFNTIRMNAALLGYVAVNISAAQLVFGKAE